MNCGCFSHELCRGHLPLDECDAARMMFACMKVLLDKHAAAIEPRSTKAKEEAPACVTCRFYHYESDLDGPLCVNPSQLTVSADGDGLDVDLVDTVRERGGACGPKGKLWEPCQYNLKETQ